MNELSFEQYRIFPLHKQPMAIFKPGRSAGRGANTT